ELEFRNSVVPAARPIGPVRLFAPPLQGRDTHTQRARNFALQLPLRRQAICLRQLRRDFHPRVPVPFLLSHSNLPAAVMSISFTQQTRQLLFFGLNLRLLTNRTLAEYPPLADDRALEAVECPIAKPRLGEAETGSLRSVRGGRSPLPSHDRQPNSPKAHLCDCYHIRSAMAELVSHLSIEPHMRTFDGFPTLPNSAPLARGFFCQ